MLPKPFTKEGLLHMLEKHLVHLKKPLAQVEGMAAPQPVQIARQLVLKEEDSPAKSPATVSWNSPGQLPGVSPVGSSVTEEYTQAMQGQPVQHPSAYSVGALQANLGYNTSPQMQLQARQQHQQAANSHRRQISDITGGDDMNNPAKRQQMYAPQLPPQMNPMQPRPR